MMRRWIFWEVPLRLTGPATPTKVLSRISAEVSGGRFGVNERLSGSVRDNHVRVWRRAPGIAADVVEFEGEVRGHDGGTVIEGRLRYNLATRVQFAGAYVLGLGLMAGAVLHSLRGAPSGPNLLGAGAVIVALALVWTFSSGRMRGAQIDFLGARLNRSLGES